jgi:hypothetical protein
MVPLETNVFLELMLSLIVHVPLRQAAIRNGIWTLSFQSGVYLIDGDTTDLRLVKLTMHSSLYRICPLAFGCLQKEAAQINDV